jgi:hypothetical protein
MEKALHAFSGKENGYLSFAREIPMTYYPFRRP